MLSIGPIISKIARMERKKLIAYVIIIVLILMEIFTLVRIGIRHDKNSQYKAIRGLVGEYVEEHDMEEIYNYTHRIIGRNAVAKFEIDYKGYMYFFLTKERGKWGISSAGMELDERRQQMPELFKDF